MRQDTGLNGDAQRIEQLGWMLFLKIFSDKDKELELMDDKYRSPIPPEFHWDAWAADDEGITGDEFLHFADNKLFPALRKIDVSTGNGRALIIRDVFDGNHNYMKSGTLIRQVLNKLNELDFNITQDRHLFGDIYEGILTELQSAGKSGEFYTPRAVTQFMTDIIAPKLGERVLDPACGTGGFLTCAIEHLKKQAKNVKQRIREKWLTDCNVHTIVRLPNSVFSPYASVATNLCFFEKGTPTKEIWYYEHRLPEGQKSYSKTKPIRIEEFDAEKSWWPKRKESDLAWKVKIADIAARGYDLDIKNPHREEAKVEYSSAELIEMLQTSFEKSSKLLQELKKDMA